MWCCRIVGTQLSELSRNNAGGAVFSIDATVADQ